MTPATCKAPDFGEILAAVPGCAWGVGVSGGADSVALLLLIRRHRPDVPLHVIHLDHETRGGASADDARFVQKLAARLSIDCTVATRSEIESNLEHTEPNLSARFRAARLELFRRVIAEHGLQGVLLAHHADDQAETVLHRLLRGSGPAGLAGMASTNRVGGVLLCRPLLGVRRDALRAMLREMGQAWREDASNDSADYLRNRLRMLLAREPALTHALFALGHSCRELRDWVQASTPEPAEALVCADVARLTEPVRREFARRWLVRAGVPEGRIDRDVIARLITMIDDAGSAPRQHFPGNVLVRRTRGSLSAGMR